MLTEVAFQFKQTYFTLQKVLPYVFAILAGLYIIHIVNWIFRYKLNNLGIYPRKLYGLIGIFFSTFLHGDFNHLFFNSIPLFVLLTFVLLNGWANFFFVTGIIILVSGIATWLFGRRGVHIGASSLIMGYWSYLMVNAYYHPTVISIVLAIICAYYLGGLFFNLFPQAEKTSWEGHVFGFLAGLSVVYLQQMHTLDFIMYKL